MTLGAAVTGVSTTARQVTAKKFLKQNNAITHATSDRSRHCWRCKFSPWCTVAKWNDFAVRQRAYCAIDGTGGASGLFALYSWHTLQALTLQHLLRLGLLTSGGAQRLEPRSVVANAVGAWLLALDLDVAHSVARASDNFIAGATNRLAETARR